MRRHGQPFLSALFNTHNNILFFGSSGGGYAALNISHFFKYSTSIVINPQTILKNFYRNHVKEFNKYTKIDLTTKDYFDRNNLIQYLCSSSNENKYIYIQNLESERDCNGHLFPLLNKLGISNIEIGLNKFKNYLFFFYYCYGGHDAQGDKSTFPYFLNLTNLQNENDIINSRIVYKNLAFQLYLSSQKGI